MTFRCQWRDSATDHAGQHHTDHDTEAEALAHAEAEVAGGARSALVYEIREIA